jgi:hypothetical protein
VAGATGFAAPSLISTTSGSRISGNAQPSDAMPSVPARNDSRSTRAIALRSSGDQNWLPHVGFVNTDLNAEK